MLLAGEGVAEEESEVSEGEVLLLMRDMDTFVAVEWL